LLAFEETFEGGSQAKKSGHPSSSKELHLIANNIAASPDGLSLRLLCFGVDDQALRNMISRGELIGVAILVVIGTALIALAPAKQPTEPASRRSISQPH
jgi:hypothetical protein